jgi:hypothetical protein
MRHFAHLAGISMAIGLVGCAQPATSECSGFVVTASEDQSSFTVPELMAQANAMGMTQQEAETLIYLEGVSTTAKVTPGQTVCIDGKPGD